MVEYIVIVGAVAMISMVGVSVFGHKVADQYAIGSGLLPGAHAEDNGAIATGFFAGVTPNADGELEANGQVSWADATGNTTAGELKNNVVTAGNNTAEAFVAED